jgi:cell division protein FtsL
LAPERRMKTGLEEKLTKLIHEYGRHLLGIFVLVLLVHDVFGTHGFLAMHRKQQEIQKVSSELERLNKENAALQREKQDLKTDPQTIRRIAREELQLAHPGEVIIKLPPPAPTPYEAPPARP